MYWKERHEQWMKSQIKSDKKLHDNLKIYYKMKSRELEQEIATYFERYAKDDVIEFRILMQDLPKRDKDLLIKDIDKFVEEYPQYKHLAPVRKSVYKLNRLEGLHYSTQMQLLELGAIEQDILEKHLLDTYGAQYQNLMKELGLGEEFLKVNDKIAKDTILRKWINNENFSDRIWRNKDKLLNHLKTNYRDGIIRGDSYADMVKRIVKRFDVGESDAMRLVWTESSFVLNQAHAHAYEEVGVEEYTFDAILDERTSDICEEMDGRTFRFKDKAVGINFPPLHAYCRSTYTGKDLDSIIDRLVAKNKRGR